LDSGDYEKKVREILNDSNALEQLATDPTEKFVKKVRKELSYLKGKGEITDQLYKRFYTHGCISFRFYGLPKIRKPGNPLRPIVSSFNFPTAKIGKFLLVVFSPLIQAQKSYIKNSADFTQVKSS